MVTLSTDSQTLSPLPLALSQGLIAVSFFGFLSFFFSTSLFLFLTYRLISWRRKAGNVATNQFLVLIYNLVIADIQQALAFLLNVSSLHHDALEVGTSTCWAQGWFVSTGDLASSVWIFAIATHTFLAVVKGYRIPTLQFYSAIAALWIFVYTLAVIGVAMHPDDLYVRAGAWCWINGSYQSERLWLHYFWIFVAMFSTITIYTTIYLTLRRRSQSNSTPIPHGATPLMILYPAIYTVCTIPLAAGRIASMAGQNVSLPYFCVAGSMIACNGWLDTLLYSLTRRSIVFSDIAPGVDAIGIQTFYGLEKRRGGLGTVTTIEGGANNSNNNNSSAATHHHHSHARGKTLSSSASTEHLYGMGIKVEATVNVRTDDIDADLDRDTYELQHHKEQHSSSQTTSQEHVDKASWDARSFEGI